MQSIQIEGNPRTDLGKKGTKAVRNAGEIPCVIYGGEDVVHFSTTPGILRHLVYTPDFKIAEVTTGGKTYKTIVKDIQFHPVTDEILHIDFVELVDGRTVKLEIPIKLQGQAKGALLGGVVQQKLRKLLVKTTPDKLVDVVTIDISSLTLGQSVRVRDIEGALGLNILSSGSNPVASVEVPRALRSAEAGDDEDEDEDEDEDAEGEEGGEETAAEE